MPHHARGVVKGTCVGKKSKNYKFDESRVRVVLAIFPSSPRVGGLDKVGCIMGRCEWARAHTILIPSEVMETEIN